MKGTQMYINKSQAELIFGLIAKEDEKLSLGEYRGNFLATRQTLVELMEKIAPEIIGQVSGWTEDIEWQVKSHREALNNDLAERREKINAQLSTIRN